LPETGWHRSQLDLTSRQLGRYSTTFGLEQVAQAF
jgi:hypothetical protein